MTSENNNIPPQLLSGIRIPEDLRALDVENLPQVCREIRDTIIGSISRNPGHFASSMGAVEIAVALHYVYNTPRDRIVWDVGHQAYAHKILTGRRDKFDKIRRMGGLSGFPNPSESEYDTFMAGHASNSISAALGMAVADALTPGEENRKTVCVIGDASISGGLAFEGLNNVSNNPNDLLIILNDNDMSIDDNVGALHRYLSEISTSAGYNRLRFKTYTMLKKMGIITEEKKGGVLRFLNSVKSLLSGRQNIFEGLNIRYFGPFDGHDVKKLVKILGTIKDMKGPKLVHLRTVKGKGYTEAELHPQTWHAPGKFDPASGHRIKNDTPTPPKWQDIFGETLVELASQHSDIVGITAAMPSGTSMNKMMEKFPERTFDVGISEAHAVTFAGGLASAGKHPYVAIYSSFLQRAYDSIVHDVAIQHLPVTFCIDRAGIVGEDGVTHHGMLDMGYMRLIPGMTIGVPSDEESMRNMMLTAYRHRGPMAIRYPRGNAFRLDWRTSMHEMPIGRGRKLTDYAGARVALIAIGPLATEAHKIVERLHAEGLNVNLYDMLWLKPLDTALIENAARNHDILVTLEDATIKGGLGEETVAALNAAGIDREVIMLGAPDDWVHYGSVEQLRALCGYDSKGIENSLRKACEKADKKG